MRVDHVIASIACLVVVAAAADGAKKRFEAVKRWLPPSRTTSMLICIPASTPPSWN
jgi:hypothetical protein